VTADVTDTPRSGEYRRFLTLAGGLTASSTFATAVSVVQAAVVARVLGAEQFGVMALVIAYPELVHGVLTARSQHVLVRFLCEYDENDDVARARAVAKLGYVVDATIAAVAFVVVAVSAGPVARLLSDDTTVSARLIVLYAAGIFSSRALSGASYAVLASTNGLSTYGRRHAIAAVARAVATVVLAVVAGLNGAVAGAVVGSWAIAILLFVAAIARVHRVWNGTIWSADLGALRGRGRELARYFVLSDVLAVSTAIAGQLDVLIVGNAIGTEAAGSYRIAVSFASLTVLLSSSLQSVAYPELARRFASDGLAGARAQVVAWARRIGAPVALSAALGGVALAPLLPHVLGDSFDAAIRPAQVLLVANALWCFAFFLRPYYLVVGRIGLWTAIASCVTIVSVPLFVVAANHGLTTAAVVGAARNVAMFAVASFCATRLGGTRANPA
jgi:O-antigen/teichoic acid export membrane protein